MQSMTLPHVSYLGTAVLWTRAVSVKFFMFPIIDPDYPKLHLSSITERHFVVPMQKKISTLHPVNYKISGNTVGNGIKLSSS